MTKYLTAASLYCRKIWSLLVVCWWSEQHERRDVAITYEEAVRIVLEHSTPGWTIGTFHLDDRKIVETDEVYVFNVGAREYLVDGDMSFAIAGGVPVVYKATGEFGSRSSVVVATDPAMRVRENPNPIFDSRGRRVS
jgi:hypothetical protein